MYYIIYSASMSAHILHVSLLCLYEHRGNTSWHHGPIDTSKVFENLQEGCPLGTFESLRLKMKKDRPISRLSR